MISEVFITCALTVGAGWPNYTNVPVTPEQIANSAIEAARARAAVVHIHVRDPELERESGDQPDHGHGLSPSAGWGCPPSCRRNGHGGRA